MTLGNDRIFYACQAITLDGSLLEGVQSIGISRATAAEKLLDLGYAQNKYQRFGKEEYTINISRIISKGLPTIYESGGTSYSTNHLLKVNGTGPNNTDPLKQYSIVIFYTEDSKQYIGSDGATAGISSTYSKCLLQSLSYSLDVNGQLTEDSTFIARTVDRDVSPSLPAGYPHEGNLIRRQDLVVDSCVWPDEVDRYLNLGPTIDSKPVYAIQNFSIQVDFEYNEAVNYGEWGGSTDSGASANKWRVLGLPVGVSCSLTGILRYDDTNSYSSVIDTNTPANQSITLVLNDGGTNLRQFHLGDYNYFTGAEISGGDTGGGNREVTLNYQNDYSDFFTVSNASVQPFSPPANRF